MGYVEKIIGNKPSLNNKVGVAKGELQKVVPLASKKKHSGKVCSGCVDTIRKHKI